MAKSVTNSAAKLKREYNVQILKNLPLWCNRFDGQLKNSLNPVKDTKLFFPYHVRLIRRKNETGITDSSLKLKRIPPAFKSEKCSFYSLGHFSTIIPPPPHI